MNCYGVYYPLTIKISRLGASAECDQTVTSVAEMGSVLNLQQKGEVMVRGWGCVRTTNQNKP